MRIESTETIDVRCEEDLVRLRAVVSARARADGFGLLDRTKLITVASELGRNAIVHGGGGRARVDSVVRPDRVRGLRLAVDDRGPGIADIAQAMTDGFSTGGGLGLGLPGSKRLVNSFEISTPPGGGLCVTAIRWCP